MPGLQAVGVPATGGGGKGAAVAPRWPCTASASGTTGGSASTTSTRRASTPGGTRVPGRRVRAVFPAVPQLTAGALSAGSRPAPSWSVRPSWSIWRTRRPRASTSRGAEGASAEELWAWHLEAEVLFPDADAPPGDAGYGGPARSVRRSVGGAGEAPEAATGPGCWPSSRYCWGVLADLSPLRDAAAEAIRAGMDDPVLAVVVSVSAWKKSEGVGWCWSGYRLLLRDLTGGSETADVPGSNVGQLIDAAGGTIPLVCARGCVRAGRLRPGLAVVIDGQVGRFGLLEATGPDSEVHFFAGGRRRLSGCS